MGLFIINVVHVLFTITGTMALSTQDKPAVELRLVEAAGAYRQGEQVSDPIESMKWFNQALEGYQSLAVEMPCASLFFNVANCYFQLGEYPWAILYYERALILKPRDRWLREQYQRVLSCAGFEGETRIQSRVSKLLGERLISLNDRLWLSLCVGMVLLVTGSVAIWRPARLLQTFNLILAATAVYVLGSIVVLEYFTSPAGILVKGALLRCDGGGHYKEISREPLRAGSRVLIRSSCKDPAWLQVCASHELIGCIPADSVRLI